MTIERLHHVSIDYDNYDETMDFYLGLLALEHHSDRPSGASPPGAWLRVGADQRINLSPRGRDHIHFALVTPDLSHMLERLRSAGCHIEEHVHGMNAMTRDPSGNWVELRRPPADWAKWAA